MPLSAARAVRPAPIALISTSMDAPISDEQLMQHYREGQYAAFEQLYARHRPPLLRFYRRQTGSPELAEELLQEVFMRLIRSRERYQPSAPLRIFLWQIARNLLIDHYRRQRRSLPSSYADFDPDQVAASERVQPDHAAAHNQQLERLLSLIGELPCAQREAFLLREEAGLSLTEIAQLAGVSTDTVKSRLRYAIGKLRRALEET